MTRAGTIPPSDLDWIRIYFNTKGLRATKSNLLKILAETGGDEMCNGAIFLNTLKPCCHLKADLDVKCAPAYKAWAISWNSPADFGVKVAPNQDKNYMECVHVIIGGKKINPINCGADMKYAAYRTAIGVKDGKFAYFVSRSRYTPTQLRDTLFSAGWSDAIMMDGGGSTCFMDKEGNGFVGTGRLEKGRVIPFFLVWKRKGPQSVKPEPDQNADPEKEADGDMTTVNAYSKSSEGNVKITKNFTVREFACNDGTDPVFVAPKLVEVLQDIRDTFGAPVTINSGYRTVAYNKKVGGAATSQHCLGTAADIVVKGKTPAEVGAYARKIMPNYGGVGIYPTKGFVHVDVRAKKTDWNG